MVEVLGGLLQFFDGIFGLGFRSVMREVPADGTFLDLKLEDFESDFERGGGLNVQSDVIGGEQIPFPAIVHHLRNPVDP